MELEIELTENLIAPTLTTLPNGCIRLSFHWRDEIRRVLELDLSNCGHVTSRLAALNK
jgi:hypothetical protein